MCLLLAGTKGGRTCFDAHQIGQPQRAGPSTSFRPASRGKSRAGGLVVQTPVQCCPRFKKKECYQGLHWKFSNRIAIAYKYPPNLRLSSSIFPSFHLSTHFYFCIRLLNLDCIVKSTPPSHFCLSFRLHIRASLPSAIHHGQGQGIQGQQGPQGRR